MSAKEIAERTIELAKDATPGEWSWFGNTDVRQIYLAGNGHSVLVYSSRCEDCGAVFIGTGKDVVSGEIGGIARTSHGWLCRDCQIALNTRRWG